MKNRRMSLTLMALVGLFVTGPLLAQVDDDCHVDETVTDCTITITLPEDNTLPPVVDKPRLRVRGNTGFEFFADITPGRQLKIDFGDRSPVIGPGGQPVFSFVLNPGSRRLDVVEPCSSDDCDYKYSVTEVGRPVLDPIIIIDR